MKIIIVTGKSGSGKSEVAKILANELFCQVLVLDEISHLSLEDKNIKSKLSEKFGEQIFCGDKIDRKKLGQIIFNSPAELNFVNELSWKFIDNYVDEKLESSKSEYIILDYALLPKMKYFKQAAFKILVFASKSERIKRLQIRDRATAEYLNLRDSHSLKYNKKDYDFIVDNSALDMSCLREEVKKIAKKIQI